MNQPLQNTLADRFVPFFQLVLASWVARALGYCGVVLGTVGVTITYQKDAPAAIAQIFIAVLMAGAHALISHLTLKAAHGSTPPPAAPVAPAPLRSLLTFALLLPVIFAFQGCVTTNGVTSFSPTALNVLAQVQKSSSALAAIGVLPTGKTTDVLNDASTISNALETINTGTGISQAQATAVAQSFKSNASTTGYVQLAATVSQFLVPFVNSLVSQNLTPAQVQAQTTQVLTNLTPAVQAGLSPSATPTTTLRPVARDSGGLLVYGF